MKRIARRLLKFWVVLAAAITLLCGLVYVAVQQSFRQGANDPQIQMAEDAAQALESGQSIDSLVPAGEVDIARSLAPYLVVFGQDGTPLASNARLHGRLPNLPTGVFDYTRRQGEDRLSWQPEPGVRSAVVILQVSGAQAGFVLAGRSLREVEKREAQLTNEVLAAWLVTLLGTFLLVVLFESLPFTRGAA